MAVRKAVLARCRMCGCRVQYMGDYCKNCEVPVNEAGEQMHRDGCVCGACPTECYSVVMDGTVVARVSKIDL